MDYVHIPLARRFPVEPYRSLIAIGALCLIGFWHGATWNFLLFGLFHGVCLTIWHPVGSIAGKAVSSARVRQLASRAALFLVLAFSAPMFVLRDFAQLTDVLSAMLSLGGDVSAIAAAPEKIRFFFGAMLLGLVLAADYLSIRESRFFRRQLTVAQSVLLTFFLSSLIVLFGNFDGEPFVYFEF